MLPTVTDNYRWEWLKIPPCRQLSESSSLPLCRNGKESRKEFWGAVLMTFSSTFGGKSNKYLFPFPQSGKNRSPNSSYSVECQYQLHPREIQALRLIWNVKLGKEIYLKAREHVKGTAEAITLSTSWLQYEHTQSVQEHNPPTTMVGNISWKGRVYELDDIN